MSAVLLTPPALEPVALAETKAFLRVEHDDDDAVIAALISGARMHVEAQTKRALIVQGWRLYFDAWPRDGRIVVVPAPLQALTAARVLAADGTASDIDLQNFLSDPGASRLAFAPWSLPVPGRRAAGIELDVTVGYGAAAGEVPEPLRQAIRLLVAHWYEHRGLVAAAGQGGPLPATLATLIAPYRGLSL